MSNAGAAPDDCPGAPGGAGDEQDRRCSPVRRSPWGTSIVSGGLTKEAVSKVVKERMEDLEKHYRGGDSVARLVVSHQNRRQRQSEGGEGPAGRRGLPEKTSSIKSEKWRFPSTDDGLEASATITLLLGV